MEVFLFFVFIIMVYAFMVYALGQGNVWGGQVVGVVRMSYLIYLNPLLLKNIASVGHFVFVFDLCLCQEEYLHLWTLISYDNFVNGRLVVVRWVVWRKWGRSCSCDGAELWRKLFCTVALHLLHCAWAQCMCNELPIALHCFVCDFRCDGAKLRRELFCTAALHLLHCAWAQHMCDELPIALHCSACDIQLRWSWTL